MKITRKIKIIKFKIGFKKNKSISPNLKTKNDVNSWTIYLYFGGTFIKSSNKLIKIKGIHNIDNGIFCAQLL